MDNSTALIDLKLIINKIDGNAKALRELPASIFTVSRNQNTHPRFIKNERINTDHFLCYPFYKPISLIVKYDTIINDISTQQDTESNGL